MDRMGNVTGCKRAQTTTPAAQLDAVYDYDTFGQEVRSSGPAADINPYHFSTKFTDPTGLVYYGYRWYDPAKGRWLGRDPIGEKGGVNLSGMVANNPTNKADILGLLKKLDCHYEISAGHAYTQVENDRRVFEEKYRDEGEGAGDVNKYYCAACFYSPNGGSVWPTKEDHEKQLKNRDPRAQPDDAIMADEIRRNLGLAFKAAAEQCRSANNCCKTITIKIRCRNSREMMSGKKGDAELNRLCNQEDIKFQCPK